MAKTSAVMVTVGEREVRVSSPDRVVYEATERTPAITKLQVCEYFAAVGPVMMRSIGDRPTAMERWPGGWREGMRLAVGPQDRDADGFYQKRLPKGAPEFVETVRIAYPIGRPADELCPTEPAALVWAAQMGALTFHPWPVRRPDEDHPHELRIDLDPQPGTSFTDAQRVADVARELLAELGDRKSTRLNSSHVEISYAVFCLKKKKKNKKTLLDSKKTIPHQVSNNNMQTHYTIYPLYINDHPRPIHTRSRSTESHNTLMNCRY